VRHEHVIREKEAASVYYMEITSSSDDAEYITISCSL
jgi:hypothetical protein